MKPLLVRLGLGRACGLLFIGAHGDRSVLELGGTKKIKIRDIGSRRQGVLAISGRVRDIRRRRQGVPAIPEIIRDIRRRRQGAPAVRDIRRRRQKTCAGEAGVWSVLS